MQTDSNNNSSSNGEKVKKNPDPDDPSEEGISPAESGRRCLRLYKRRDDSVITDLFLGQFRSTLKCTVCSNESVTFEPFWVISLPIPPSAAKNKGYGAENTVRLEDCMDLFVKGIKVCTHIAL